MTAIIANLLAYDRQGRWLAITYDRDVLVHRVDGQEGETPLWQRGCEARLVGVGATSDAVLALEETGRLVRLHAATGTQQFDVRLAQPAHTMSVAPTGIVAVALSDAVAINLKGMVAGTLLIGNPTALAWSDDGTTLAVGSASGRVQVFLVTKQGLAKPLKAVELGASVRCIAWNTTYDWIVSAGAAISQVMRDGSATHEYVSAMKDPAELVTCSHDGNILAFTLLQGRGIAALSVTTQQVVANIEYDDCKIVGLAFGAAPFLGVGLDSGDANMFDLQHTQIFRTNTHPGRTENHWQLRVAIHPEALPMEYLAVPSESTPTASRSYPAWMGPIIGAGVGAWGGASAADGAQPIQVVWLVLGGAIVGAFGGMLLAVWDVVAHRRPSDNKQRNTE